MSLWLSDNQMMVTEKKEYCYTLTVWTTIKKSSEEYGQYKVAARRRTKLMEPKRNWIRKEEYKGVDTDSTTMSFRSSC